MSSIDHQKRDIVDTFIISCINWYYLEVARQRWHVSTQVENETPRIINNGDLHDKTKPSFAMQKV